jgi:hypothetical protein
LLDTARDEALPWFWRSVCLEHTTRPLARLTTLLKRRPGALRSLFDTVHSAQLHLLAETRDRVIGQTGT